MSRTSSRRSVAALSAALALPFLAGSIAPTSAGVAQAPAAPEQVSAVGADAIQDGGTPATPSLSFASTDPTIDAGPTTHWVSPNAKFQVKAQLLVDGKAPASGVKGSVILQQKFGSEWVNVGKPAKLSAKGLATIAAISEDFQKTTTYRVASGEVTSNEFTVELGAGKHTAFKLFKNNPRWQPCSSDTAKEPIVYQLNLDKKPAGWDSAETDIKAAIADISAQTGIVFTQHTTGTTTKFPTKAGLNFDDGVDMVIAAGDATDSNFLPARLGKVLAVGGFNTPAAGQYITKGYVMIDNRQKLAGGAPVAGKGTWQMVVRHELAHAMGVTHPSDAKQVMNPTYNNLLTEWGGGDLNALQAIGVRAPGMVFGQKADACWNVKSN